jgi:sorting nexin-29
MLAYADDMGIVGRRVNSVKESFLAPSAAAKTMGLKVSEEKTKCMQATKRPTTLSKTEIGGYNIERTLEFKYWGKIVTNNNNMDKGSRNRIIMANKYYHGLKENLSLIF